MLESQRYGMSPASPDNTTVAETLEQVGDLLERQEEAAHRARSYRRAAGIVRDADRPVAEILRDEGEDGLTAYRGIGDRLAGAVREIIETGRLGLLDRLEAETDPPAVLAQVPGIGEELAGRIHNQLDIESLEALEQTAHDGRLSEVEGLGEKRVRGIRDALAGMLSRSASRRARQRQSADSDAGDEEPPVDLLLAIDREYREKAEAGQLRTIAPKRFNPEGEAWLPIMKTERRGWSFTVLFSNTARAHDRGKTHDWVVIYYSPSDGSEENQCTVITAERGPLGARRVIPGRRKHCREYYRNRETNEQ
jgi:hypothetical protein